MFHELLFALNGHEGYVFTVNFGNFKVNDSLPFFHPAEVGILNKLLEIATDVWNIQSFVSKHRNSSMSLGNSRKDDEATLKGLYLEALCDGLDEALVPYRQTIADVEKTILKSGGETQLALIQYEMSPFQPVVRVLHGLIDQIELQRPHGCLILDVVYRVSCSGVSQVRHALQRILCQCHEVFYKQLLAWILKGELHDPHGEFIIEEVKEDCQNGACGDLTQSFVSSNTSDVYGSISLPKVASYSTSSCRKFRLRVDRIPSHISVTVAEKIFFVGETVQLFEADAGGKYRSTEQRRDVLKEREVELSSKLSELRDKQEFRVADFERFIDSVRETVSSHLRDLIWDKSNFKQELEMVRDVFLLGRGELYQMFIAEADKCLRNAPNGATQYDADQAFANACRVTLPESDDKILRKITVRISLGETNRKRSEKSAAGVGRRRSGWECMNLQYSVPWPLHLILTPSCGDRYNEILKFLLNVRRTQHMLHETWSRHIKDKSVSRTSSSLELRSHMMFVVDNLQQYLMVDALESQYSILMNQLDSCDNFEEMRHAHDVFLNSIVSFTFIHNDTVSKCLNELLSSCQSYCSQECQENGDDAMHKVSISDLASTFARQSDLLFRLLSSIQSRTTGSQLAQLLLRIDYNRYFSKHGHTIG